MKSLLAKIAVHKAVGLYLGEHEVAVSKVAATPLGPVESLRRANPTRRRTWPSVLERLLAPLLGRKRRLPVAVGLPGSRLFFGTRLIAHRRREHARSRAAKGALFAQHLRRRSDGRSAARRREQVAGGERGRLPEEVHGRRGRDSRPVGRAAVSRRAVALRPGAAGGATASLSPPVEDGVVRVPRRHARAGGGGGRRHAVGLEELRLAGRRRRPAILSAARTLRTQQWHYGIESSPGLSPSSTAARTCTSVCSKSSSPRTWGRACFGTTGRRSTGRRWRSDWPWAAWRRTPRRSTCPGR